MAGTIPMLDIYLSASLSRRPLVRTLAARCGTSSLILLVWIRSSWQRALGTLPIPLGVTAPIMIPGWVYHGLLIGTPGDAVRFLHSLMSGEVLPSELLTEMATAHPIGDRSLPGRPWETTGYGLGLMIGRMASAGIAMGHSGVGPGSVSAVYHFCDRPSPCTVAAFAIDNEEGAIEYEAVRLAR